MTFYKKIKSGFKKTIREYVPSEEEKREIRKAKEEARIARIKAKQEARLKRIREAPERAEARRKMLKSTAKSVLKSIAESQKKNAKRRKSQQPSFGGFGGLGSFSPPPGLTGGNQGYDIMNPMGKRRKKQRWY